MLYVINTVVIMGLVLFLTGQLIFVLVALVRQVKRSQLALISRFLWSFVWLAGGIFLMMSIFSFAFLAGVIATGTISDEGSWVSFAFTASLALIVVGVSKFPKTV